MNKQHCITLIRFLNVTNSKWTSSYSFRLYRERQTQIEAKLTEVRAGQAQVIGQPLIQMWKKLIHKIREICSNSIFTKCWISFLGIPSTVGGFAVQHEEQDGGWNRPQGTPTVKHSMQIWGRTIGHRTKLPGKIWWNNRDYSIRSNVSTA